MKPLLILVLISAALMAAYAFGGDCCERPRVAKSPMKAKEKAMPLPIPPKVKEAHDKLFGCDCAAKLTTQEQKIADLEKRVKALEDWAKKLTDWLKKP